MITKRFIKSSIIYTVAGALPMANAVLLLPFYLHYLPASEFGALALYLSFSILVQIIVTYSFDASLYLYFHEFRSDPERLNRFVSSAFTFVLLLGTAVSGVLLLTGGFLFHQFFTSQALEFYPFGLFSAVTAVFQSVFKVNNSLLQSSEKPTTFLWSNVLSFFLVAVFNIAGLKLFPGTLMGPVGGKMLAFIISGLWVLFRIYKTCGFHFDVPLLRVSFGYNNYQIIYQVQQWVINYFDRPIMAVMIAMVDLGVYDFTIKCLLILDFLISGLFNSFFPKILARTSGQEVDRTSIEINRYYNGLTAAIMMMVAGSILVLPVLITLFVKRPGYGESAYLVPYASLVFLLRAMRFYFGLPYSLKKYNKPFPIIFLIVSATKIGLSIFLIGRFGIFGAAGATVICSALEILLVWGWMKNRFHYTFNTYKLLIAPLSLMAVILLVEPWLGSTYPIVAHLSYVLLTGICLLWVYRNELPLLDVNKILKG